ncbi:MAG: hypothetical protein N4A63_09035 [Vallitalea sp.]|jgi:hypothetical protein|nr:hypothetical protein [Vallitalea sp.]
MGNYLLAFFYFIALGMLLSKIARYIGSKIHYIVKTKCTKVN